MNSWITTFYHYSFTHTKLCLFTFNSDVLIHSGKQKHFTILSNLEQTDLTQGILLEKNVSCFLFRRFSLEKFRFQVSNLKKNSYTFDKNQSCYIRFLHILKHTYNRKVIIIRVATIDMFLY